MRYLILSDIHANIDALDSVLAAAPPAAWDRVVVLGDLVGYGAEPNQVVDRVLALDPLLVIRGNHDKAACGIDDGSSFNVVARTAAEWTMGTLRPDNREYLRRLPAGPAVVDEALEICHGAPFDEDHYIFDSEDAARALDAASRPLCLFGHTHLPVVFLRHRARFEGFAPEDADADVPIEPGVSYLINVGSVGQPRDGDPRAAFGIYDAAAASLRLRRVAYPVALAQRRILDAGLPSSLASRLGIGR
ncbi:MAG: metallophosphatase family protein [Acidobacteriota bacterium]|nr:metallophosphatase family protein [Acidobacteriota bacterium]